jgi:haloacetate dehalogenase
MRKFFAGFGLREMAVADGTLRVRLGGAGPALLLLHGNPQTHAMWNEVAPALRSLPAIIWPKKPPTTLSPVSGISLSN